MPPRLLRLDVPDRVERLLELAEDAGRAEQQRDDPDHRRDRAALRLRGVLDHLLHPGRGLRPEDAAELSEDLPLRGLAPEHHPGDGDGDQQQRREREDRVVRQRGAEPRALSSPNSVKVCLKRLK